MFRLLLKLFRPSFIVHRCTFERGTTRISIRTFVILNIYIYIYISINGLGNNLTSNILKFADHTKVFRKVNTDRDKQHLQNDLDKLVKLYEK